MSHHATVLVLLPLLFVISLAAHAQVPRSHSAEPSLLRGLAPVHAAHLASQVRPSAITHLYNDDLNWINETRTRNVFEGGLLHEQYGDRWEGHVFGDWADSSYTEFAYAGGLMTQSTTYGAGSAGWTPVSREAYTYQGIVMSEVVTEQYADGAWVLDERTVFGLNDGQIVSGLTSTWTGSGWEPAEQFTLVEETNTSTNVVETYQVWTGTNWQNSERTTYPNRTVALLYQEMLQLIQDLEDYEGISYGLRLPSAVQQEWDGARWVNVTQIDNVQYVDLFTGHLLTQEITTSEWMEGTWAPSIQIAITYADPASGLGGMPGRTAFRFHDGEAWVDVFAESYIIQNDIKRIVQATTSVDFGEGMEETARTRIDWVNVVSSVDDPDVPSRFELRQNAPNPFNPTTTIAYQLAAPQHIRLAVYDLLGRELAVLFDGPQVAGQHSIVWEAANQPSGMYLYRLEAAGHYQTRQMVLLK